MGDPKAVSSSISSEDISVPRDNNTESIIRESVLNILFVYSLNMGLVPILHQALSQGKLEIPRGKVMTWSLLPDN